MPIRPTAAPLHPAIRGERRLNGRYSIESTCQIVIEGEKPDQFFRALGRKFTARQGRWFCTL
jgi:hypothetical protein